MHVKTEIIRHIKRLDKARARKLNRRRLISNRKYRNEWYYYPFKTNSSDIKTDIWNLNFLNTKRENPNRSAIATYYWQGIRNSFTHRLRAVSYFSLQSYYTQSLTTRAAKPLAARNEGVTPRRKNKRPSFLVSSRSLYNNIVVCNRAGWDQELDGF